MIKLDVMIIFVFFVLIGLTVKAQENSEGQILDVDFDSETLGRTYQYKVYLPAGYDSSEQFLMHLPYLLNLLEENGGGPLVFSDQEVPYVH